MRYLLDTHAILWCAQGDDSLPDSVRTDIHRDPFDRLLVAQALEEGLVMVTCDRIIPRYPVQTVW